MLKFSILYNLFLKYLKDNLKIKENVLKKIKNEEIDGDALILLFNTVEIDKLKIGSSYKIILPHLSKNIFRPQNGIENNEIYKEIYFDTQKNLFDNLDKKLEKLKLNDKLKYLKYLIIRYPPPAIDNSNELKNYLKTFLNIDDLDIDKIIESFDKLNFILKKFFDIDFVFP